MNEPNEKYSHELAEHFFRNEYGKIVSVITRYVGTDHIETAEDIVQETLLKAVHHWQHKGIPENPQGWLYATAKNLTLNLLKRQKIQANYRTQIDQIEKVSIDVENLHFSEKLILDEQLKMMFVCCHPSLSENSKIALILKILCGFSITEIAHVFFTSKETINKRLVRGRKLLRENKVSFEITSDINENLHIILKTLYLLFTEGYNPSQKSQLIRYDLCLEAIRMTKILVAHSFILNKGDCLSLLALMYLNASRFDARMNDDNSIVEMEKQDRGKWNQELINTGIQYLNLATEENVVSSYLILATISANHCIAGSFKETNWKEILSLYDNLIALENSPVARLNRSVALAKIKGNAAAIAELNQLEAISEIGNHYLFHSTLAEFYRENNEPENAHKHYEKAILLTGNKLTLALLEKKITTVVPNS